MTRPIVLIGAEFEENLSLRYLASAVELEGFSAVLLPFNDESAADNIVREVLAQDPLVVGISMPFQLRAREFLRLATRIRDSGSRAHITLGGHFATFEYESILRDFPAVDSVVRHEGELTLTELCLRLRDGDPVADLTGAVVRSVDSLVDGGKRRIPALDDLSFPSRRGNPQQVIGVPISPILGSRGCYADCSFCCIYAYAENADGARYRRRSPENIFDEMREEYVQRGIRMFVFHDDNFFVPSRRQNIARYTRLKELLDGAGMTDIGLVIKCRPNDVHPDLFALLKSMGLIRAYVGIETNSDEGIVSLNRRITSDDNRRALEVFRDLEIYNSFNVLIFDPEATMGGIERNLEFMEHFADTPFNFCRAEVYAGTPLKEILEKQGRLKGDYFGWGYEMRDPRVELLFRIAITAFSSRNFKHDGVANLNMGIRCDNEMLRRFYPECWDQAWNDRVLAFSRAVGLDTVRALRDAHAFAATVDPYDGPAVKRFTIDLARRVARSDLTLLTECKALRREIEHRVRERERIEPRHTYEKGRAPWAAETSRLAGSVGLEVSSELLPAPTTF